MYKVIENNIMSSVYSVDSDNIYDGDVMLVKRDYKFKIGSTLSVYEADGIDAMGLKEKFFSDCENPVERYIFGIRVYTECSPDDDFDDIDNEFDEFLITTWKINLHAFEDPEYHLLEEFGEKIESVGI